MLTDNEIINSYNSLPAIHQLNIFRNLYYNDGIATEKGIVANALNDILPQFDRQKAEIERLKELNADLVALADRRKKAAFSYLKGKMESDIALRTSKAEAIKEFAERLKAKFDQHGVDYTAYTIVDDVMKEMGGNSNAD